LWQWRCTVSRGVVLEINLILMEIRGEGGRKLLDKYGIEYHIVKIYTNGVRIGYIPDHDKKNKQYRPLDKTRSIMLCVDSVVLFF